MQDARIGEGVRVLVLGSGKAGHEVNAAASPRRSAGATCASRAAQAVPAAFAFWAGRPRSAGQGWFAFRAALPDIVIACGRVTVPYVRAFKRAGREAGVRRLPPGPPLFARAAMDLIWAPEHDRLSGGNVIVHADVAASVLGGRLAAVRAAPDPRLAALPGPRARSCSAGPSGAQDFSPADVARLAAAVAAIARARLQRHGDALAAHAARTRRRGARGARRCAGLRLGRRGRQSLRADPRSRRRASW